MTALTARKDVDWPRVEMFHLDEYVGTPDTHPASFRLYLRERIVERVHPGAFHFLAGDAQDPLAEGRRVGALLAEAPVDVAFVGIGATGTGSIGAVSVGIAEALIETALGLFVAIPAVWFYNYLTGRIEYFNVEMDNSSSELVDYFIKQTA